MKHILILTLLWTQISNANPVCATAATATTALKEIGNKVGPKCIPEIGGAKEIEAAMNDPKNNVSDDELFIRLIFAESLASDCTLSDNAIYENIAWTLRNRVDRKKQYGNGTNRGVVLKPSQFSSSTGSCDVAKRTEFFCPTSSKQFEQAWAKATQAWQKTKKESNPIPSVRHYFFPKHFDSSKDPKCLKWKGVLPSWATKENTVKTVNSCATFHNVKE